MAQGWQKDYFRYRSFFLNILRIYNSKPSLKVYLELILSLATIAILSVAAIKPTALTIIELQKEIKQKEETSQKLLQKTDNLQTASDILQNESSRIAVINQAVPTGSQTEVLIRQIESLAVQNQLQITGLSSSDVILSGKKEGVVGKSDKEKFSDNINSLPFTISVSGPYQNLFTFLTSLENLRRPVKIDTFSINTNVSESGKILILTVAGRMPFLYE